MVIFVATTSDKTFDLMLELLAKPWIFKPNGQNRYVSEDNYYRISIWKPAGFLTIEFSLGKVIISKSPPMRKMLTTELVWEYEKEQISGIVELNPKQIFVKIFDFESTQKLIKMFCFVHGLRQ